MKELPISVNSDMSRAILDGKKTQTFKEWHEELTVLAEKHNLGYLILPAESYPTDGYDNDLTPNEELGDQFSAACE